MNLVIESAHRKLRRHTVYDAEPLWARQQQNTCFLGQFLKHIGAVRSEDDLNSALSCQPQEKLDEPTLRSGVKRCFDLVDQ